MTRKVSKVKRRANLTSGGKSVNRTAVARWRRRVLGREMVEQFMEQLRKATEDRLPPEDDFEVVTDAPPPSDASPASPPASTHELGTSTTAGTSQPQEGNTVEDDWRRAAQAEGF